MNVITTRAKRASIALRVMALLVMALLCAPGAKAQFAAKTNLLYDATLTPNLGAELGVGARNTFSVVYGLNQWKYAHGSRKVMHWTLMPEYRWWTCSKFDGHFFGVHAMGGQFNAANVNIPFPGAFFGGDNITKGLRNNRYEGWYVGGGVTYGYQWVLSRHWNLEAEVGVGYDYVNYKKFRCAECGGKIGQGHTNYVGITKLGLSFIYIF